MHTAHRDDICCTSKKDDAFPSLAAALQNRPCVIFSAATGDLEIDEEFMSHRSKEMIYFHTVDHPHRMFLILTDFNTPFSLQYLHIISCNLFSVFCSTSEKTH